MQLRALSPYYGAEVYMQNIIEDAHDLRPLLFSLSKTIDI